MGARDSDPPSRAADRRLLRGLVAGSGHGTLANDQAPPYAHNRHGKDVVRDQASAVLGHCADACGAVRPGRSLESSCVPASLVEASLLRNQWPPQRHFLGEHHHATRGRRRGDLHIGASLVLDPGWTKPMENAGLFVGQIFGNALYEEIVYRGFLTVQVYLLLRRLGRNLAMVLAVVMVQAVFATIHIPMLIVAGHGWAEVVAILPQLFIMGVALAIIYLVTGNLLIAVGAHALADAYMQIPRDA